ncbi:MAG: hypothetical protein IJF59_01905, partial [Clostridia bacterium]|nr:hypothetical protein [Clostridia bacterium]
MEHQSKPAAGTPLTSLPGVGEAREALLERLGIHCAEDLLRHFPRDYEDRTVVRALKELREGERCSVRAFVITAPSVARIRKGMEILRFRISDGTAQAEVSFFNQTFRKRQILQGGEYVFYGEWEQQGSRRRIVNPAMDLPDSPQAAALVPIYPLTAGLAQAQMRRLAAEAVRRLAHSEPETLPEPLRRRYDLMDLTTALTVLHAPTDLAALREARRRMVFEEMLLFQLGLGLMSRRGREQTPVHIAPVDITPFYRSLPFEPTGAQKR